MLGSTGGVSLNRENLRCVFVVPYSHIDWAWRNNRHYFLHRNRQVLFAAVDYLEAEARYRWSGIHRSHVVADFWEAYPALRPALVRAVREHRLDLGGSAHFTPLTSWVEEELFFRNLLYGRRFFERLFGEVRDTVLYFADVPVTFAQVPQIASKFGFEYTIIDRPSEALERKGIARQFRWRSPEGSELITDRTFYGRTFPGAGGNHVSCSPGLFPQLAERTGKVLDYLLHDAAAPVIYLPDSMDWAFPTINLPEFVDWWNGNPESPHMTIATHTEYFDALSEYRDQLPVAIGNLDPVGWNGFYGGHGEIPNTRLRVVHNKLLLAERLSALARVTMGCEYPEPTFEDLFSRLGVLYCHGGYSTAMVFPEDFESVEAELQTLEATAENIVAEAVGATLSESAGSSIFNPLPWERAEWVSTESGMNWVRALPLCWSGRSGENAPAPVTIGLDSFENDFLHIDFGPQGISGITDKETGRPLLSDEAPGTLAVDRGKINLLTANFTTTDFVSFGHPAMSSEGWRATARQIGSAGANSILLTTELRAGERILRLSLHVASRETNLRYRLCLPLSRAPEWRLFADDVCAMTERFLTEEPMVGLTRSNPVEAIESPLETTPPPPEGCNVGAFYAVNVALAHDREYGVALINRGTVGYVWDGGTLSNILLRTVPPGALDQYANATYLTGIGDYDFEVAVFAAPGPSLAPFLRMARNFVQPLFVGAGSSMDDAAKPLVVTSADNVVLSGLHFDRGELVVRAYELQGSDTECVFIVGFVPAAVRETDFRGESVAMIPHDGSQVRMSFRAWEIKEIRFAMR